ncbi:hypothetical protein TNCV_2651521 [Trichonephila clavipes]|nr:hypothetical protein TNCV_2651521 [Trichonephila clavipes]
MACRYPDPAAKMLVVGFKFDTPSVQDQRLTNYATQSAFGRGNLVVKVSDLGWYVTSSNLVPLKTRRVGKRCTLKLVNSNVIPLPRVAMALRAIADEHRNFQSQSSDVDQWSPTPGP